MAKIELIPFDASHREAFVSVIEETGIKMITVGKGDNLEEKPMAYIKFADGSPDISFFIDFKGESYIVKHEKGNIKSNSDLAKFADISIKFGFKTYFDDNPEDYTFESELVGHETIWAEKKKLKKVKANGEEAETDDRMYFMLCGVDGKLLEEGDFKKYGLIPPDNLVLKPNPKKTQTPAATQAKSNPETLINYKEKWKDVLLELLIEPLTEAGIHKAILEADKLLKPDDPARKLHAEMAKVRKGTLIELSNEKFIQINENGKYELV